MLFAVSTLTACTLADGNARPEPSGAPAASEVGVADLDAPWSVALHGMTALVSERDSARILEIDNEEEAREVLVIADVSSGREGRLLGIPSASNHNGRCIAFGPDGMLYATTGDAGNAQNAKDLDSSADKILARDGEIPKDNPIPNSVSGTLPRSSNGRASGMPESSAAWPCW